MDRTHIPKVKRWHFWQEDNEVCPFPITRISELNDKIVGYFTGMSVEVFDQVDIATLYDDGCYGIGSKTKSTPKIFYSHPGNLTKRRLDHNVGAIPRKSTAKNKNSSNLDGNVIETDEMNQECDQQGIETSISTAKMAEISMNVDEIQIPQDSGDGKGLGRVENGPNSDICGAQHKVSTERSLGMKESLNLYLEEAFFLHHSLKCLTITDFFENVELTTNEILTRFCSVKHNFITSFVVYQYYRSQNWVVNCGLKYGGDFRKF